MFLGMQTFDFAHIESNLPKSNHFAQISNQLCPNFNSVLPNKFNQFRPNLINFAQQIFRWGCGCIPAP